MNYTTGFTKIKNNTEKFNVRNFVMKRIIVNFIYF